MTTINIPDYLKSRIGGHVEIEASTFGLCLTILCKKYQVLEPYVFNSDGSLVASTCFYLNDKNIADYQDDYKSLSLSDADQIDIEPAIVGG